MIDSISDGEVKEVVVLISRQKEKRQTNEKIVCSKEKVNSSPFPVHVFS